MGGSGVECRGGSERLDKINDHLFIAVLVVSGEEEHGRRG